MTNEPVANRRRTRGGRGKTSKASKVETPTVAVTEEPTEAVSVAVEQEFSYGDRVGIWWVLRADADGTYLCRSADNGRVSSFSAEQLRDLAA